MSSAHRKQRGRTGSGDSAEPRDRFLPARLHLQRVPRSSEKVPLNVDQLFNYRSPCGSFLSHHGAATWSMLLVDVSNPRTPREGTAVLGRSPSFRCLGEGTRSPLALWVKITPIFAYNKIRDQKVPETCQSHSQTKRKWTFRPGLCDLKTFIVLLLPTLMLCCSNTVSVEHSQSKVQPSPGTSDSR